MNFQENSKNIRIPESSLQEVWLDGHYFLIPEALQYPAQRYELGVRILLLQLLVPFETAVRALLRDRVGHLLAAFNHRSPRHYFQKFSYPQTSHLIEAEDKELEGQEPVEGGIEEERPKNIVSAVLGINKLRFIDALVHPAVAHKAEDVLAVVIRFHVLSIVDAIIHHNVDLAKRGRGLGDYLSAVRTDLVTHVLHDAILLLGWDDEELMVLEDPAHHLHRLITLTRSLALDTDGYASTHVQASCTKGVDRVLQYIVEAEGVEPYAILGAAYCSKGCCCDIPEGEEANRVVGYDLRATTQGFVLLICSHFIHQDGIKDPLRPNYTYSFTILGKPRVIFFVEFVDNEMRDDGAELCHKKPSVDADQLPKLLAYMLLHSIDVRYHSLEYSHFSIFFVLVDFLQFLNRIVFQATRCIEGFCPVALLVVDCVVPWVYETFSIHTSFEPLHPNHWHGQHLRDFPYSLDFPVADKHKIYLPDWLFCRFLSPLPIEIGLELGDLDDVAML